MFLLIDKPSSWNSFKVIHLLRKRFAIRKIGHAGTLDPLATGLLIVACGQSTKLLEYLFKLEKTYLVTAVFGLTSRTYDFDAELHSGNLTLLPEKGQVISLLRSFQGEIEHTPPPFSAVKIKGRRAYELARKGNFVKLPKRKVVVSQFKLFNWRSEFFQDKKLPVAQFLIECSTGTYVRSIVHELGERVGCGAVVKELRRTRVGQFSVDDPRVISGLLLSNEDSFQRVKNNISFFSLPYSEIFSSFPSMDLSEKTVQDIRKGRLMILRHGTFPDNQLVLGLCKKSLVCTLRAKDNFLIREKLLS